MGTKGELQPQAVPGLNSADGGLQPDMPSYHGFAPMLRSDQHLFRPVGLLCAIYSAHGPGYRPALFMTYLSNGSALASALSSCLSASTRC